jgi:hypothetical protein
MKTLRIMRVRFGGHARVRLEAVFVAALALLLAVPLAGASFKRYTVNLTLGDQHSTDVAINESGDYMAYVSGATNQVPGAPGTPQVYTQRLTTGAKRLASVGPGGVPAADPAADVSLVNPFVIVATAAPDVTRQLVSGVDMSATGDSVTFTSTAANLVSGDVNGVSDVFVNGRRGTTTELVSRAANGGFANGPSWGASYGFNERWVAFISTATNLVRGFNPGGHAQAYLRDLRRGKTYPVSINARCKAGNGDVLDVAVSEGRYVAFTSDASNLVRRDTNRVSDIFVHEMFPHRKRCGITTRQSVSSTGRQANGPSQNVTMGVNGKYLAYESTATNLVRGDTNGVQDIFWRIRKDEAQWLRPIIRGPKTLRVSVSHLRGHQLNGPSFNPEITAAGRFTYFDSAATNVFKEDTDTIRDIYHHDLKSKWTTLSSRRDGRRCSRGDAFECSEGTPLGGVASAVSYHGTDIVFLSIGKNMRDQEPPSGEPGVVDALMRYLGPMSAPVPREYR